MADLALAEFGFPGPLRDQLVAAILDGSKTSTTGLLAAYEAENEDLPTVGARYAVPDSDGIKVAVIETTEIRVVRLADVELAHVIDEGEGDRSIAQWREGHTRFFQSDEMRQVLGDPDYVVADDTPVVLERFRLVSTDQPRA